MGLRILALSLLITACGGGAHHHGPPIEGRADELYVEISPSGSHGGSLRAGADAGLSRISYAVPVDRGGEIELEVEVAGLDVAGGQTVCQVKVLVLRLPRHSLLGIADGSAKTRGTDGVAGDDCVEQLTARLIQGKVSRLLRRQLRAKR